MPKKLPPKTTDVRLRLVVNRSNKHVSCQLIGVDGKTLATVTDIKSPGSGTKLEKAKNVGLALAKVAKGLGITKIFFDRNSIRYHGRIKSIAEGAREGGLIF